MVKNEIVEIPFSDFTSGVFIGITSSGECVIRGLGELDKEDVAMVTSKMILMVSKLRNAALRESHSSLLH